MEQDNIILRDTYGPANSSARILAALVDLALGGMILVILEVFRLPGLGGIIAAVYLIFRDSIPATGYQSYGKKLLKIKVIQNDEMKLSFVNGLKRNFIFLPNLFGALGLNFFYVGGGITLLLILLELYQVFTDDNNQRFGDKFADTEVIAMNRDIR